MAQKEVVKGSEVGLPMQQVYTYKQVKSTLPTIMLKVLQGTLSRAELLRFSPFLLTYI
jgi:hypothetical protein